MKKVLIVAFIFGIIASASISGATVQSGATVDVNVNQSGIAIRIKAGEKELMVKPVKEVSDFVGRSLGLW